MKQSQTNLVETVGQSKIVRQIIRRYYVQIGEWVFGGPFETRVEAQERLNEARRHQEGK
jgi:hypothetical protein